MRLKELLSYLKNSNSMKFQIYTFVLKWAYYFQKRLVTPQRRFCYWQLYLCSLTDHQTNTFSNVITCPDTFLSPFPPLISTCVVTNSPECSSRDYFQVSFLRAKPFRNKAGGIFRKCFEEKVL